MHLINNIDDDSTALISMFYIIMSNYGITDNRRWNRVKSDGSSTDKIRKVIHRVPKNDHFRSVENW